jgi:two-component system vancomycin resistance associated response regulator VraR
MILAVKLKPSQRTESSRFSQVTQPDPDTRIQFSRQMPKTVLVADDNEIIRREICQAFSREAEFEVCGEARHGLDAIEKAHQLKPDLVVLDLCMPVLNGLDTARVLQAQMPAVPIIMFTLYVDPVIKAELRSAGVAEVVSKGEDISILTQKARSLLYRSAA